MVTINIFNRTMDTNQRAEFDAVVALASAVLPECLRVEMEREPQDVPSVRGEASTKSLTPQQVVQARAIDEAVDIATRAAQAIADEVSS